MPVRALDRRRCRDCRHREGLPSRYYGGGRSGRPRICEPGVSVGGWPASPRAARSGEAAVAIRRCGPCAAWIHTGQRWPRRRSRLRTRLSHPHGARRARAGPVRAVRRRAGLRGIARLAHVRAGAPIWFPRVCRCRGRARVGEPDAGLSIAASDERHAGGGTLVCHARPSPGKIDFVCGVERDHRRDPRNARVDHLDRENAYLRSRCRPPLSRSRWPL